MWLSIRPVSKQVSLIAVSTNFPPTRERCAKPIIVTLLAIWNVPEGEKHLHCPWRAATEVHACDVDVSSFWNVMELAQIHRHWNVAPVDSHYVALTFHLRTAISDMAVSSAWKRQCSFWTFKGPSLTGMHVKNTPKNSFYVFRKQDSDCILKTCCIISVLFYTKCLLFYNCIFFCSNNMFFTQSAQKFKYPDRLKPNWTVLCQLHKTVVKFEELILVSNHAFCIKIIPNKDFFFFFCL